MTWNPGLFAAAILANAAAAVFSRWRRSVSMSGAVAGFLVGAVMLYAGRLFLWGMLMLFFVSSSVISRVGSARKKSLENMHQKGHERDALQVIANGGVAALASLLFALTGGYAYAVAAAGALAAANADTWASEIGVLNRTPPRSVVTRKEVAPGESGGVSRLGNMASLAGALAVGIWFAAWTWGAGATNATGPAGSALGALMVLVIVAGAGFVGCFLDSFMGATVQILYRRPDGTHTEQPLTGEQPNEKVRGRVWMTNDIVNVICTVTGALVAGGVAALL